MTRELTVLGTTCMVPRRASAHRGAVLRWDDELVLVDRGEGTQRQLTLAGMRADRITRICVTHVNGDHALGLSRGAPADRPSTRSTDRST